MSARCLSGTFSTITAIRSAVSGLGSNRRATLAALGIWHGPSAISGCRPVAAVRMIAVRREYVCARRVGA